MIIDQRDVCVTIRDNLLEDLSNVKITSNRMNTYIKILSSEEIKRPDIVERIQSILRKYTTIYTPRWSSPNQFVAIQKDKFANIEIRIFELESSFRYDIYIYISPTEPKFEWWYDRYMDSK